MPLTVRLFPKGQGAEAYAITGIASRCDWVVLSDTEKSFALLRKQAGGRSPRHVFLSMRNPKTALLFFRREVLPKISGDFILISGSEDTTLPRQIDKRWEPFDEKIQATIREIVEHPRLIAWHAENLDRKFSEKVHPLPTGMVYPDSVVPTWASPPQVPPLGDRPMKVLVGHRVREGEQWRARRAVSQLCASEWSGFVTHLEEEVSEEAYVELVKSHSFVLCAEGGGLDPSPKAWQALQYGAIPIIRKSPVSEAYRVLPCAIVDRWRADQINEEKLAAWKKRLLPSFDTPDVRRKVLGGMTLGYWWKRITEGVGQD